MPEKEVRVRPMGEVRAVTDDDGTRRIEGYAIRYNEPSEDLGGFVEYMAPGSVRLREDLRMNFDHQTQYILGRTTAGTLVAESDDDGVGFTVTPPDTQWARDLMTSMDRGDIRECSFEMYVEDDTWQKRDGIATRTVTDADVVALSIVSVPAYPTTSAQARSMAEALLEPPADGEPQSDTDDDDNAGRGVMRTPVHVVA